MDVRDAQETKRVGTDGQVVRSWPPDAGVKLVEEFTGDGGYQARHPGEITKQP